MDGVAVKVAIILTRTECSILFWNKEEWGSLWGFGGYNASGLKMFIDESLAGFLFNRVKGVDFRNLLDKGILEFNGVIKGLMRGENMIGLFQEDISKISAEIWDWDFLWFLSLSKLCQDGDLVDLFF